VVAEIAVAGQPDAAVDHRQLTAQATQRNRFRAELEGSAMKHLELRIHHQSPVLGVTIIGHSTVEIQ
jgi:hypothetical protein